MMSADWNAHRFSGGPLALCAANSVIWRGDPARRADRFADPAEISRFAAAANFHCSAELCGQYLAEAGQGAVIGLREAVDALFRGGADEGGSLDRKALGHLLGLAERAISSAAAFGPRVLPLDAAIAHSALHLAYSDRIGRVRICGNCGWLFEDQSRNGSRLWCDMAVCGNRAKARRHYHKRSQVRHADH